MFQRMPRRLRARLIDSREGSALVVVLVVIVLLSLAAYSYSEKMVLEAEAAEYAARRAQARVSADSGIEYVAAILGGGDDLSEATNLYHDPALFGGVTVPASLSAQGPGLFTIVAPVETDVATQQVRFGLMDESGKLNLNAIAALESGENPDADLEGDSEAIDIRDFFIEIPGITDEAIDGILDWIDEDFDRRQYGAEDDVYETLQPPYFAKNAPLESLDELLLVNGITAELLYGEDANRNGLLDASEDDGDMSLPLDNADGILDLGWAAYFTVTSRESNLRSDGEPKIDVNLLPLSDLADALDLVFEEEQVEFILAYHMFAEPKVTTGDAGTDAAARGAAEIVGGLIGGNSGGGGSGGSSSGGGEGGDEEESDQVTYGNLDLSASSNNVKLDSLYELIDLEFEGKDKNDVSMTFSSPWTSDAASVSEDFVLLLDNVTTYPGDSFEGRINVNQARREVLLGIPNMEPNLVNEILASQQIGSEGEALSDPTGLRQTSAWLLAEGLADVELMQQLDPYITGRGAVYTLQVLGHSDRMGPIARVEAIIDATSFPPRVTGRRDLSDLGPGYDVLTLLGGLNLSSSGLAAP